MAGGREQYHRQLAEQGKMFVRRRLERLFGPGGIEWEDGLFAEVQNPELPADAVVTGVGRVGDRRVAFAATDSTVKAGSMGPKSVEKILRIQETAMRLGIPILYLMDSAGARIVDQVRNFPGRRHGGRIFYNQVHMSGVVPQISVLFGPSPAGAAYIPAFSDVVIMVEGQASAYLGSPRMAEMAIGEKVTLEEMGGARMHCTVSGLGDFLVESEEEAIRLVQAYLSYMPSNWQELPPLAEPQPPEEGIDLETTVPADQNRPFDMYAFIRGLVDAGSFLEVKRLFAPELITGLARLGGQVVGVVANQPRVKGGTLFVDSADKGARFIWLCNAYNIPLLFLADVPGFMIGSAVERQGIIRHGAKMIAAVSEATVPKISVIVRKCYGAGLYAMAGPAFGTDAVLALPSAQVAVMGPEAAVNAVFYNDIQAIPDPDERRRFVAEQRERYARDIDIFRLAGELIVDDIVAPSELRDQLIRRFRALRGRRGTLPAKHCPVHPV
ncbi:acyl-CoA carboxylase subunit beta [Caldinitratiruptor microaerophilus]|nr:acyl-CoA carboxylase subunit beta [Caldinitratiruptor microaerophilus]